MERDLEPSQKNLLEGREFARVHTSTQTILVVPIVDSDLNRHGGINEADDGGWNADEVGVSAICGASKARDICDESTSDDKHWFLANDAEFGLCN